MTDIHSLNVATHTALAELLDGAPEARWAADSLCTGWQAKHVVAHMTMAGRLTPDEFGAEMAAAEGDFTTVSNTVAARDAELPREQLVAVLRDPAMHAWEPPGGGAAGALNHVVIHSLDITTPQGLASVAPKEALVAVLDSLVDAGGRIFGTALEGIRLEASDADWARGEGPVTRASLAELVSLAGGRTLPDGRTLPRRPEGGLL